MVILSFNHFIRRPRIIFQIPLTHRAHIITYYIRFDIQASCGGNHTLVHAEPVENELTDNNGVENNIKSSDTLPPLKVPKKAIEERKETRHLTSMANHVDDNDDDDDDDALLNVAAEEATARRNNAVHGHHTRYTIKSNSRLNEQLSIYLPCTYYISRKSTSLQRPIEKLYKWFRYHTTIPLHRVNYI